MISKEQVRKAKETYSIGMRVRLLKMNKHSPIISFTNCAHQSA